MYVVTRDNSKLWVAVNFLKISLLLVLISSLHTPAYGQESKSGAEKEATKEEPAETASENLPKAKELFTKHLKAIGGEKAIRKHKSHLTKLTLDMPSAGIKAEIINYAAAPNSFCMQTSLGARGEMRQGFDGKVAWSIDPMMGARILEGEEFGQLKVQADFYAAINYKKIYKEMETVSREEFNGKTCFKVHVVSQFGQEEDFFYDVESGLHLGSESTVETVMGMLETTTVFGKYGDFGGILQPITTEISMMGQKQILTLKSIEYDKVDKAVFALPEAIKVLVGDGDDDADEDADENADEDGDGG